MHNTTKQLGVKILPLKSKVMTFKGQVPIRSKPAIDDSELEQVLTVTYLGHKISYEEEMT
jgi:hypothetical protein